MRVQALDVGMTLREDGYPSSPAMRLQLLQRQWWHDAKRRDKAAERLKYYKGEQISEIRPMPDEPPSHFVRKPKFAPNIAKLAIHQLSYLWNQEPIRTSEDQDKWREILWERGGMQATFSAQMQRIDRFTRLLGHVNVLPFVIEVDGKPCLEASIFTPDRFCVLQDRRNPYKAVAALYKIGAISRQKDLFLYLDDEWVAYVEAPKVGTFTFQTGANGVRQIQKHGLDRSPVVEIREEKDPECYYGLPYMGEDLCKNLRTVNEMWTEYLYTAKLQRGQPVAKGGFDGALACDSVIQLEPIPDSDFDIISNKANLSGIKTALVTALEILAKTMNLPSRTFRLDDRAAKSGLAIHLDRHELEDDRKAREPKASNWEYRLHIAYARVWKAATGEDLSVVSTRFQQLRPTETADLLLRRVDLELQRGLMDAVEAKVALHPNLTMEKAKELQDDRVQRAIELGRQLQPVDAVQEPEAPRQALPEPDFDSDAGEPTEASDGVEEAAERQETEAEAIETVQDTALNGAQVTSLQGIVISAAAGELPIRSARAMILAAFPRIDTALVEAMLADVESLKMTRQQESDEKADNSDTVDNENEEVDNAAEE